MSIVYAQKNLLATTGFPSTVEVLLAGLDSVSFQLAGTWTGTVVFESTTDGNTYAALSVTPSTGAAAVTSATANGIWAADRCAGFYSVRARCSVFGSGVIVASVGAGATSVEAITSATDGQVLFMDGAQVSGDSGLTFNKTTNVLTVSGGITATGFLPVHQATVTLTNAQILSLMTVPVQAVATPGANKIAFIQQAAMLAHIVTPYTGFSNDNFSYLRFWYGTNDYASAFTPPNVAGFNLGSIFIDGRVTNFPSMLLIGRVAAGPPDAEVNYVGPDIWAKADIADQPLMLVGANTAGDLGGGNASNTLLVTVSYLLWNTSTGLFE